VDAKIPIGAIYGAEMGSLIGGLYAEDGKINHFEWALLRFKQETIFGGAFLSSVFESISDGDRFEKELAQLWGSKDLSKFKVPFKPAILPQGSKIPQLLERGEAVKALRCAMAVPKMMKPCKDISAGASADGMTQPTIVADAKNRGLGPVIVVDATSGLDSSALTDADLVIRPDLGSMDPKDFDKRTEAVFAGKTAAQKLISEIKHLVGMPSGPSSEDGSVK
jgi:predicted acylesterase/phospholipase RssA